MMTGERGGERRGERGGERAGERPDIELLRAARREPASRESRRAAAELLSRYRGRVYQWCWRYVRDREEALDLTQDVLLSAFQNLASFGERARFSSWLFAITRHRCLSALRRPALLVDDGASLDRLTDPGPGPDRELMRREEEAELLGLMSQHLDPLEQEALWLRCYECMPVDEITGLLGIDAVSGARGVLQSARRKLRRALEARRRRETGGRGPVREGREGMVDDQGMADDG